MRWMNRNGLHYLQFPRLSQLAGVEHGVFLRLNDRQPEFSGTFNLGLGCGDSDKRVWDRRRQIRDLFGMEAMILARQVHGAEVRIWLPEEKSANGPDTDRGHIYLEGDALVTDGHGQILFIQTADCQSVLIADPHKRVVANIHSGWRGSIANIIGRTVNMMVAQFGCLPDSLWCAIGPSLGPCCAEFVNYRDEFPRPFWRYRLSADRFDFWRISLDQLVSAGVKKEQVETSHLCTRCNPHLFFSYRGEGQTGRFAAVIGLRKTC